MSVEELIDIIATVITPVSEVHEARAELLRRYEVLEKELKAIKLAHAVEKNIMTDNFNLCKSSAEQWEELTENMKCCGNCDSYKCTGKSMGSCCSRWSFDGLIRHDRE